MNKEYIQALEIIKKDIYDYYNDYIDDIIIMEKALYRLESIDNANPSEALECLKKITDTFGCDMAYYHSNSIETVKQSLIKAQEQAEIIKEYDLQSYELREALLLYAMYKGEYKGNPLPALKQAQEQKDVLKWLFEFLFLEPKQIADKYYVTYMNREEGNYILEEVSKEDYNLLKEFYHGLREGIY